MLNFNTFFAFQRILHISREQLFSRFLKNKICKFFCPFEVTSRLKVQICFGVFLFLYAQYENMPKEFYRSRRIRQKYLIDVENARKVFKRTQRLRRFKNGFIYTKSSLNTPKVFQHAWRTRLKNINAFGEYAKSILPYMENTPIDIKVSL